MKTISAPSPRIPLLRPSAWQISLAVLVFATHLTAATIDIKDKTLVAWVAVDDLSAGGGSALTLGEGQKFDALVYGEKVPNKWSAGSEFWSRHPEIDLLTPQAEVTANRVEQVALVQQGTSATLYRDGKEVTQWTMKEPAPEYDKRSYVMFGWRHNGATEPSYFQGTIEDARIYDHALTADQLKALKPKVMGEVKPLAWWDFKRDGRDEMGAYPAFELHGKAKIEDGKLHLHGPGDYVMYLHSRAAISRVQYRPNMGNFADPIPFFWKGQYHVFYLQGGIGRVPWQHLISDNLVDWKQVKTALTSDGAPDSWDGGNMFTGTVIENKGRFYCYYTGDNGANPLGNEGVRLATSDDLITWTKQPDFLVVPDGTIYAAKKAKDNPQDRMIRDFRDPFPYKIEGKDEWWMILCANDEKNAPGVYTSNDLQTWTAAPPLDAELQECPDLFKIGDTYYLMGADHYATSKDLRGKFVKPEHAVIDRPGIYAGKRMFDGKRHIFVGWIADNTNFKDDKVRTWGGTMCSPRELVPGPDGILYVRPAKEVIDAFSQKVLDTATAKPEFDAEHWTSEKGQLTSKAAPAQAYWTIPAEGMLTMKLKLSPDAKVTVAFHCDPSQNQEGYMYTFSPAETTVRPHGQDSDWPRSGVHISADQPVLVRAILIGDSIEFFINDQYAFTRRAYDLKEGKLGLQLEKGSVTVEDIHFSELVPAKD